MSKYAITTATGAALLLTACASTPDVSYQYYPAKSMTTLTVNQTIDCTEDKQSLIVTTTPQPPTTVYAADYTSEPYTLPAHGLDSSFADADVSVTLSEDGRLKAINTTWTGQGQAIVTAAMTLIKAAAALGGNAVAGQAAKGEPEAKSPSAECAAVANWGNGKPVTLTYSAYLDLSKPYGPYYRPETGGDIPLIGAVSNKQLFDQLHKLPTSINAHVQKLAVSTGGATYSCSPSYGAVAIKLRKTAIAHLEFQVNGAPAAFTDIIVPDELGSDQPYCIAVPKAQWFGSGKFALSIADSGAITSLEYGKTNGGASALGSANTVITTFAPSTPSGPPSSPSTMSPNTTPQ